MDLDATQAIPLDDYDDETDEEISQSQKEPVSIHTPYTHV